MKLPKVPKVTVTVEGVRAALIVLTLGYIAFIFGFVIWAMLEKGAQ